MPVDFNSEFPLFSEGVVDRTVFGTVLDSAGQPLTGLVTVKVQMESLDGGLALIGEASTNGKGEFMLPYDPAQFSPQILRVSLEGLDGNPTQVVVSPAQNERVEFRIGTVPGSSRTPKFTDVSHRVQEALDSTQATLPELDSTGVARLSLVSGVHPKDAALVREAAVSESLTSVSASLFYALGRGGLTPLVADLVKHSSADRHGALDRAIASGTLSPADAAAATAGLAELDDLMLESALQSPQTVATPGLALDLAGVTDPVVRKAVLETWVSHTGSPDSFWAGLGGVTATQKNDMKYALQLDSLTRSNAPLVQHLFTTYDSPTELAALDVSGWASLVATRPAPQFLQDAGVDASRYARGLFCAVEDAFPTQMLSARSGWFPESSALSAFLANHSDYELNGLSYREYVRQNELTVDPEVAAELPILERLYRIAPRGARFEVMRDLRGAHIVSATQIQIMGRARFMAELGTMLGEHAEIVFRRAKALSSAATMVQARHGASAATPGMAVLPVVSEDPSAGTGAPITWEEMFQGRTFCTCGECQSAHGPAAYLADLLFWLRSRDMDGSMVASLLDRRNDLAQLELSCKNAETALPTIDLVLEQLERMVEPEGAPSGLQTTLDADELAARPEHVHPGAYDRLAGKNDHPPFYPFDQPYVAALDRTRTFLGALGVDRAVALMTTADAQAEHPLDTPEIAAEVLGMTRTSWEILAGEREADVATRWGLRNDLFRPHPTWATGDAAVVAGQIDVDGGARAVTLTDGSGVAAQSSTIASTEYRGGSVAGSLFVKKDAAAAHFVEVRLGFEEDYPASAALVVHLGTGATQGGTWESPVAVESDGDWWRIAFQHAGVPSASSIRVRVTPAAGTSFPTVSAAATGSTTIYAPRVAFARPTASLEGVPAFLAQAGDRAAESPLSYDELEDLLRSRYVQDAGPLAIWFADGTCDIASATLVSASFDAHLDRLSCIIRLSRDLGWSIRDVDRAIETFRVSPATGDLAVDDIGDALLRELASVRWLERMFGKSPSELLDWWGSLDTRRWTERLTDGLPVGKTTGRGRVPQSHSANAGGDGAEPSPFQRLVRLHDRSGALAVSNVGTELVDATRTMRDHVEMVAAVIGVDPGDLGPLVDALPEDASELPAKMTLATISRLHAQVEIARALGLSTSDVLEWMERTGVDPLASPLHGVRFATEVKRSSTVRVDPDALEVILAPRGARDLGVLDLPTVGAAMLALADEVRANPAVSDAAVLDTTTLDGLNLLGAPADLDWMAGGGAVVAPATDPSGGTRAVTIDDADTGTAGFATVSSVTAYPSGQPVWGSLWLRKKPGAVHYAEVGLRYDTSVAGRIAVHLGKGEVDLTNAATLTDVTVRDAGDWWLVAFRHLGAAASTVGLIVYPAVRTVSDAGEVALGAAALGAVTAYGARIAEATTPAADPLYPYAARDRAIVRRIAALLELDAALVSHLLAASRYENGPASAFEKLIESVSVVAARREATATASATVDPEGLAAMLEEAEWEQAQGVWELVAIAGWICRTFALRVGDLDWLLDADASVRGFELEKIVFEGEATVRYAAWAKLRDAMRLQQIGTDGHIFDLLGEWAASPEITAGDLRSDLAERTGWSEADIIVAIDDAFQGPLGGGSAASWAQPARLMRLAAWMELARRLRVSAASVEAWALPVWPDAPGEPVDAYEAQAQELERSIRGVWGVQRWLSDMPAVRDSLRDRQRRALISRVVGGSTDPDFGSAGALGERLLMDVHMGACARTSRIKDAIRTVQVFVQRVLLGAEGGYRLTEEEADEWVWRKSYRVWEANRKVFLYPENWLRPELRTDKTPFFAELETELAGGDLSAAHVEDVYRAYLRKLSEVSKLEVLSVLREERDGHETYHVFARTRGIPQAYFHREWIDGGRWTPWRAIPKAEGEHLIPVIYQRRLMLFWLNVSETAPEPSTTTIPGFGEEKPAADRYFKVRLSWTEHRDGRWSAPITSDAFIGVDERGTVSPPGSMLTELVATGVGPTTGDRERSQKTYSPTILHTDVALDDSGRDLLIQLFRDEGAGVLTLPRFRISGIDGHVAVEESSDVLARRHAHGPSIITGREYEGRAQRFRRTVNPYADQDSADLSLPLSHASGRAPALARVLQKPERSLDDWIQITPSDRVRFDPKSPFVFEDNVGSYWVTYSPMGFFAPIGFGGSYWPGADHDLPLLLPERDLVNAVTVEMSRSEMTAFRSKHEKGTDGLVDESVLRRARASGKDIIAINGTVTDKSSKKYALNSSFLFEDAQGETKLAMRAGATWDADAKHEVQWTYPMPEVSIDATSISEGFHFLLPPQAKWRFDTFFHPHVGAMREAVNRAGVFGLLAPSSGSSSPEPLAGQDPTPQSTLSERYTLFAVSQVPSDGLDFSAGGAYAQYNWELFFHAPFLVACRLHEAGRFDEALEWLHVIFDPHRPASVGGGEQDARSYWRFRPFREEFATGSTAARNIQQLIALLTASASDPDALAEARDLLQQIVDWRRNPFDPHAIARTRLVTYMTAVVMKYLEVVIDAGDQLFAQDTLESIGQATELYLLAARILGPRPEAIHGNEPPVRTFGGLVDDFTNGVGPAETIEESLAIDTWEVLAEDAPDDASSLATLLYFCVPANPQLASRFWDRVAGRLFNIRNCLDIQGRRRDLALFEPPIDPELLVRAAAAGADFQSVLADIVTGRVPHRRYLAMAELAAGLAASAQGLGQSMLVAIEKRDADQLATLRSVHEQRLQEDAIHVRREQIVEIEHQLSGLRHNRDATARRLAYYKDRPRTNTKEAMQLGKARSAKALSDAAGALSATAAIVGLIPELDVGTAGAGGSPKVTLAFGGKALAAVARAGAASYEAVAGALEREGRLLLAESGYDRRHEEWQLQAYLAQKDLDALDTRILAMEIQVALTRNALATAELRMAQIQAIHAILEQRFARQDLYEWLKSELASLHYQSYQLAYEFAKKAEKAWQYELGRNDTFVQFGYWDSHRKGLLAADKLAHDLRRMQVAYTELSTRRLEVDQTFSLRDIDPVALLRLQRTGSAEVTLPEAFFDLYYPGHVGRRIRAVRFTVPAVVPPHTNVPLHVELIRHWIRGSSDAPTVEGGYGSAPVTMTSTSSGQRDAGVFELDFRSPRLLPFEGAGAVSRWRLTLPMAVRPFHYRDIQDVLVHVAYDAEYSNDLRTALESEPEGGAPALAYSNLFRGEGVGPRRRVISMRQEHGAALRRLVQAASSPATGGSVSFEVTDSLLPSYLRGRTVHLSNPRIVLFAPGGGEPTLTFDMLAADAWAPWDEAGGAPHAPIGGAFPATSDLLVGTHTVAVSDWGTRETWQRPDFDILIVVDLNDTAS